MIVPKIQSGQTPLYRLNTTFAGQTSAAETPANINEIPKDYSQAVAAAGMAQINTGNLVNEDEVNALFEGMQEAGRYLINSESGALDEAIIKAFGVIADVFGVQRVHIWENEEVDGKFGAKQRYEWAEGVPALHDMPDAGHMVYEEVAPDWPEILKSRKAVHGLVRDLPPTTQAGMQAQGIKSVLVVPIFVKEEFWGFLSLDNFKQERDYTRIERNALGVLGGRFASAFLKDEAYKNARQASEAKSDLIAGISHDDKNTINGIIHNAIKALKSDDTTVKDDAFRSILALAGSLLETKKDLLTHAKLDAGKVEVDNVDYNFRERLRAAGRPFEQKVANDRKTLSFFIDNKIPEFVYGDDIHMGRVVNNLISNAVKFIPAGSGTIFVNAVVNGEIDENGKFETVIQVIDNGIGMSQEQQSRVFQKFEQAEKGTSRRYGGTGLGLSISKNLVELMGGEISVSSVEGQGTIFTIKLPTQVGQEPPSVEKASPPAPNEFAGKKLLLVDDVEINLDITSEILAESGIEIDLAHDGQEAVEKLKASPNKYDVVFMDLHMPNMDGYEAAKAIRELGVKVPIVAMSADNYAETFEECQSCGMNNHLPKPLEIDRIAEILRWYLAPEVE